MIDSRCHSFEDAPSARIHDASLTASSQADSFQDGLDGRNSFQNINSSLLSSPDASNSTLSLQAKTNGPRLKENRTTNPTSPKIGRSPVIRSFDGNAARKKLNNILSPDRFVPKRGFGDTVSTTYHLNKSPQQLSPDEKLLRRRLPGDNPFLPTVSRGPEVPSQRQGSTRIRQRSQQRPRLVTDQEIIRSRLPDQVRRQISSGSVWGVGGASVVLQDTPDRASNYVQHQESRGSTAPVFVARFLPRKTKSDDPNRHEARLALALDIDLTTRLLDTCSTSAEPTPSPTSPHYEKLSPFEWKDNAWKRVGRAQWSRIFTKREAVPPKPFRILDAPYLRDDFYCSTLAYSLTSGVLAVGLAQNVYLWSEGFAVGHPPFGDVHPSNYVTSLSFSSENGGRSILAVGRQSGQLTLWSVLEPKVRFDISHPNGISCVAFKPKTSSRLSCRYPRLKIKAEDLVAGDDVGNLWYYSVEWPDIQHKWGWKGSMTLLAKISAHSQQVCGLAWSPDDEFLATGGNDNACLLFELRDILRSPVVDPSFTTQSTTSSEDTTVSSFPCLAINTNGGTVLPRGRHIVNHLLPLWASTPPTRPSPALPLLCQAGNVIFGCGKTSLVPPNRQRHRLVHSAAVKAIAFAPWQPSLLATGGGSNDRAIHFFHARTGVCLATINVFAQVTCLIWSQTRREIAATFGYAQPEHPYRIAVFSWPSCAQIAVIPWGPYGSSWNGNDQQVNYDCGRALWAVSYSGCPPRPVSVSFDDSDLYYSSAPLSTSASPGRSQSPRRPSRSNGSPGGPRVVRPKEKEGGMWCARTMEEGCIIVASSDQTVKFHEVWSGQHQSIDSSTGLLGGSAILESMEGIEKSGSEVIR
ncbi:hypothetical protein N7492_003010 [Penicillium capsulatum]|uniref:Anaphase-promoting complex subunit 4 WD40 domain-containing protein n=1 Tax=Penicillium capsulatum TaxID=69766 RepID=A0A9W9LW75_9EURO|nr:hypothetical protein N7492_003010 [Penicillium capsulatum]KAJ6122399.1 hypothetical protein N7512_004864 [Penicillium capsulatum]